MAHEDLNRKRHVAGSSNRTFGLVMAALCLFVALGPLLHGHAPRQWAFIVAGAFALIALLKPVLLTTPNRLWTQLGVLLGRVVSPIALGILFYGVFTPVAFILRFTGQDPLRRKLNRDADSYWIVRDPPGPPPDSMTNQF
jgi:Saxitoxin biosynthesis operon protein SxtJ